MTFEHIGANLHCDNFRCKNCGAIFCYQQLEAATDLKLVPNDKFFVPSNDIPTYCPVCGEHYQTIL